MKGYAGIDLYSNNNYIGIAVQKLQGPGAGHAPFYTSNYAYFNFLASSFPNTRHFCFASSPVGLLLSTVSPT
jgi:hypothetical protein